MSRTYHATGTGSFTRAFEVRKDRSDLRKWNTNPDNLGRQELEPMHGATRADREGKITYEQAMELIKPGDKIRTPDGILHKVTAENKAELVGRLGATVSYPAKDFGRAKEGSNIIPRGTTKVYKGNLSTGTAKIDPKTGRAKGVSSGQRGKAGRITTEWQRKVNRALPFGILEGIGRGSKGTKIGFKPQVGPVSTYKASPNSKKTAIQEGKAESKGNAKLNARIAKVGGFAPKSSRAVVSRAYAARRAANAKQRAADKKAGIVKPVVKRGPRKPIPEGEIRSTTSTTGTNGARINAPKGRGNGPLQSRKGGRSGRGRSR